MAINTPADLNSDNPLHKYRTYSYHHVLLACVDNTIVESAFTNMPFDQLLPTSQAIGNITARCTPRYVDNDTTKPYIVMINTQVDSEFLIKAINFKLIPAPPDKEVSGLKDYQWARAAFVNGGNMVIDEPFGIRFGDMMSQISQNLGAPPERVVFVLKTAFFGFTDQGVSTIQQIKPLALCFIKIDATFTAAGGHYELEFVPYANGFANRKEIANAGSVIKFQTGDTLQSAMSKMVEVLNKEQQKLADSDKTLQPVNYNIILDDKFKNYTFSESISAPNKNKNEIQFCASANDSISQIIEKIMMLSPQVQTAFTQPSQSPSNTETNPNTDRFIFKIYSDVVNKEKTFIVTYHVYPQKVILAPIPTEEDKKNPTILIQKRKNAIAKFVSDAQADNNYLEYNYIYSGKNVDILEFEMRLNLWTTFQAYYMEEMHWQAKSQVKNKSGAGLNKTGSKNYMAVPTPDKSGKLGTIAKQPPQINNAITDLQQFQQFDDYLTRTVSLSTGGTYLNMTIAGDPRLYAGYLQSPFDKDGKLIDTSKVVGQPNMIMNNWAQVPALVQINVFMPNPPTSVIQDQTVQQAFAAPFWFDGLYQIMSITNMFSEDGRFTQQLELLPISGDYNVADLTSFDTPALDSPKTAVSQLKVDLVAQLTDDQKRCLAHARQAAINNNMPVETLQAILLVDSGACTPARMDSKINKSSNIVHGATTLTVGRVQTYLSKDPSPLEKLSKQRGISYTNNPDSIRLLLFSNDEFNLDMCAKIWLQDRALVNSIFTVKAVPNELGITDEDSAPPPTPGQNNLTDQATLAHHTMAINSDARTAQDDVSFTATVQAPITAQAAYIKQIQAQKDLIIQYNSVVFPQISRPNA